MRDPIRRSTDAPPSTAAPAKADVEQAGAEPKAAPAAKDVVIVGPPTADGAGLHVLRAREGERLEAGELRTLEDGKPIEGEIVSLAPRADHPRVFDVKDSYKPPASSAAARSVPASAASPREPRSSAAARKGPAQVASQAYRDGWDSVFAPKRTLN
jgi:hypothetical protein